MWSIKTGWSWERLLTLDLALWRAAMPCCLENFPLSLPFPFFLSLCSRQTFQKTLRGRCGGADGRQSSHNHTIYIYPNILGRGKAVERREGEGDKVRGGTNSLTQTENLDMNTLSVWLQGGGGRSETWISGESKKEGHVKRQMWKETNWERMKVVVHFCSEDTINAPKSIYSAVWSY